MIPLEQLAHIERKSGAGFIYRPEREAQVLRLLAAGATNAEIAQTLCIAEGTVKNHISNLYQRLDLHRRAEAAAWAWKHGYVDKNTLPS